MQSICPCVAKVHGGFQHISQQQDIQAISCINCFCSPVLLESDFPDSIGEY